MKNTKLGSVKIYYSTYNKAAVLEKKIKIVLKSDASDHRYDRFQDDRDATQHSHLTTKSVSNAIHSWVRNTGTELIANTVWDQLLRPATGPWAMLLLSDS